MHSSEKKLQFVDFIVILSYQRNDGHSIIYTNIGV